MKKQDLIVTLIVSLLLISSSSYAIEYIYATDGVDNIIRVYDKSGKEVSSISNSELNFPTLLEGFNDGRFFITDINFVSSGGPDLVKMDLSGNIIARTSTEDIFGETGGGIVDVINSGSDSFYITSTLNTEIAEIDSDLNLIRRFPSGARPGGLRILGGAVSNDGKRLYVADADGQSGHGFVRIYDTNTGSQVDTLENNSINFPFMLEFNAAGDLIMTDRGATYDDDRIMIFHGNALFNSFNSGAPVHDNFGNFDLDSEGNIVLLETNLPTETPIRILDIEGHFISEFGNGLQNPHGIMVMNTPVQPVPEPSTLMLLVTGVSGLLTSRNLRRN